MGMANFAFRFWDAPGTIGRLLDAWTPAACTSEAEYERSLFEYLQAALPEIEIARQYGWNRSRVDIVVGGKVALEIKSDLDSTGKYHRLVGQISEYKKMGMSLFIVLCGRVDPQIENKLRREFDTGWLVTQVARVVRKG